MTSKLSWVQTRRSNLEVGGNGRFYSFNSLGGRKAGKKTMGFSLYCCTVYHYHPKLLWSFYFDSCFEWTIDPIFMDTRPQSYFQGYDSSLLPRP